VLRESDKPIIDLEKILTDLVPVLPGLTLVDCVICLEPKLDQVPDADLKLFQFTGSAVSEVDVSHDSKSEFPI
jgi:hypothetical protein